MVTRVISNKADAPGLAVAESNAIPTAVFQRADYESNEAHEAVILEDLLVDEPDFICLAGYVRVLSGADGAVIHDLIGAQAGSG